MTGFAEQMEEARRRNVMASELAQKPAAFDPAHLPERIGVELKLDGIGLLDVNGRLLSLEGVAMQCAAHLAHELGAIRAAYGVDMMLHGEFLEPGGFNTTLGAFRTGESAGGIAVLWDAVTLKAWHGYEQSQPLIDRRRLLEAAFETVRPGMIRLNRLVPFGLRDEAGVLGAMRTATEGGHEGLVVKDMDAPYQRGTNRYWMKVKPDTTLDVPIQGVRLDEAGRVKSIIVTVDGKPALVGSGISELLRNQPEEFTPGRLVEVRHVGKTEHGALRGASFVRFRDDKEKTR